MKDESVLLKFKSEVTDSGAMACLPANLSDDWIVFLETELRELGNTSGVVNESFSPVCAIAAVITILAAKNDRVKSEISHDRLLDYLDKYRIELGLELIRRKTDIKFETPTLEDVFTQRTVGIWKE